MDKHMPSRFDIQLKSKSKTINIIITLLHPITTVIGYSGTGKTYLCNLIKDMQSGNIPVNMLKTTIPLDQIVVIDSSSYLRELDTISDKLVIIDNFNRLFRNLSPEDKKRIIDKINNSNNLYILMFRGANEEGLEVGINSLSKLWADVEDTNNCTTTYIEVFPQHSYIDYKKHLIKDWSN